MNYLDRSPGPAFADEDNARFVDRNDRPGRLGNRDGFIHGPVVDHDGRTWVNDRLNVITYDDLMPRVMRRVADEVAACLRQYGARPENRGRLPWATPLCRAYDPDPALRFADATGILFGRVPDTPFLSTQRDGGAAMLPFWVQGREGCRIADPAGVTVGATGLSWWNAWKRHVFYALSLAFRPNSASTPACDRASCLVTAETADTQIPALHPFAVLVAGTPLRRSPVLQARGALADLDASNWLEGVNADLRRSNPNPAVPECAADLSRPVGPADTEAGRVVIARTPTRNDVVVAGRLGNSP